MATLPCQKVQLEGFDYGQIQVETATHSLTEYPIPANTNLFRFGENAISDIPQGYFAAAPNVAGIYLQINQLTAIEKHMFSGLASLVDLLLYDNKISLIEPESFKDNQALRNLHLHCNLLQTISESVFDPLSHPGNLQYFYIWDNPLNCESLCWMKQVNWLTVYNPQLILCAGNGALSGCKWNELKNHDICPGRFLYVCIGFQILILYTLWQGRFDHFQQILYACLPVILSSFITLPLRNNNSLHHVHSSE